MFNKLLGCEITFNPEKLTRSIDYYHLKPGAKGVPLSNKHSDKRDHRYVPITLGSIYRSGNTLPGAPSYRDISTENTVHDPKDYTIIHKVTIEGSQVFLDDHIIANAPYLKNKAFKERFCKAVVWSLLNDPVTLEDKLKEITGDHGEIISTMEEAPAPVKVDPFSGLTPFIVTSHYSVYEVPA